MRIPGFASRNLRLKLLATVIAVVTWAGVVYAANPPGTRVFAVAVPQDGANLPAGFLLVRHVPDLLIRVAGTQDHLNAFNPSSLTLKVHYENITQPGTLQLPIDIRNSDPNVELDRPPSTLQVEIDRLGTANVTVHVVVSANPPAGYVTSTIDAAPSQVTVTGPGHELSGIQVRATVDLSNKKSNIESDVLLHSFDAAGRELTDVNATPEKVRVLITVAAVSTQRQNVPAVTPIQGSVAPGFRIAGVSVKPSEFVNLTGSQEVLQALDSIPTDPVDVTGMTANKTFKVKVKTPAGVTASPGDLTVTILVVALPTPPPTPPPTPAPTP